MLHHFRGLKRVLVALYLAIFSNNLSDLPILAAKVVDSNSITVATPRFQKCRGVRRSWERKHIYFEGGEGRDGKLLLLA